MSRGKGRIRARERRPLSSASPVAHLSAPRRKRYLFLAFAVCSLSSGSSGSFGSFLSPLDTSGTFCYLSNADRPVLAAQSDSGLWLQLAGHVAKFSHELSMAREWIIWEIPVHGVVLKACIEQVTRARISDLPGATTSLATPGCSRHVVQGKRRG